MHIIGTLKMKESSDRHGGFRPGKKRVSLEALPAFHPRMYWPLVMLFTLLLFRWYLDGFQWEEQRLALSRLMDGTAHRPFVYRVLVPYTTRLAVSILPLSAKLFTSALLYLFLSGSIASIRSLSSVFWKSDTINNVVGVLSIILLVPFMMTNRHVYDFSTLFLFSSGLTLMARKKWRWYFLVYVLACLNKETTILLTGVFLYHYRHAYKTPAFRKLLALQIAIYTGIRAGIMWVFAGNPGAIMEHNFFDHAAFIRSFPALVAGYAVYVMIMSYAIQREWKRKPAFLKDAFTVLAPLMFALYLLGGAPFEIRVFYELSPVLILLAAPSVGRFIGLDFFNKQDCNSSLPLALSDHE
jgi:hypothetical protein